MYQIMEKIHQIINRIKDLGIFGKEPEYEFKKPDAYKNINTSKCK